MSPRLRAATRAAWAAVIGNWRAFLLIESGAVLLVLAYYLVPGASSATYWLAEEKARGGLVFVALTTAFAGAVFPAIARRVTSRGSRRIDGRDFTFQLVFFALLGITVDLLYRGLTVLFGASASPAVVCKKVLFDQFIYSPFVSMVLSTTLFLWKDAGFSYSLTRAAVRDGTWAARYASLMILCWPFWIPMLACVYAIPSSLQFCLFLCADGAWALLLLSISGR